MTDGINDGLGDDDLTAQAEVELRNEQAREQRVARMTTRHGSIGYYGGGAFVSPTGKQEVELRKAQADRPPVINQLGGPRERVALTPQAEVELLRNTPRVHHNLAILRGRLYEAGWKPSGKQGQDVSPNGILVDMGYTYGEVWVRAWSLGSHNKPGRTALWTKRITKAPDPSDLTALTDEAFQDLETLEELASLADLFDGDVNNLMSESADLADPGPTARIRLQFRRVLPGATLPTRAFRSDAGLDLYVCGDLTIAPGAFVDVPCGVALKLPSGYWARITGRSSTLRKRRLLVNEGIIDTSYDGPLFAGVQNLSNQYVEVKTGERLAQVIIHRNHTAECRVEEFVGDEWPSPVTDDGLGDLKRGDAGFGSSGR